MENKRKSGSLSLLIGKERKSSHGKRKEIRQPANWPVHPQDVGTLDSGLNSTVLASNNEFVILPVNEPTFGTPRKSQIQTYLEQNEGPGLQHLALKTDDIFSTLRLMSARSAAGGFEFMPRASDKYYRNLPDKIGDVLTAEQYKEVGSILNRTCGSLCESESDAQWSYALNLRLDESANTVEQYKEVEYILNRTCGALWDSETDAQWRCALNFGVDEISEITRDPFQFRNMTLSKYED